MRRNQFSLTLIRFAETCEEAGCDTPCVVHVYSDSNNLWQALSMAFASVTSDVFGCSQEIVPQNCARCDVATTHAQDEKNRHFAKMALNFEKRRNPWLSEHEGTGACYVHAHLQRFSRATPEEYPKNEQVIDVTLVDDDVFAALSNAHVAVIDKLREYEPVAVPSETLKVRTNIDEEDPLVGAVERSERRKERMKERASAASEQA